MRGLFCRILKSFVKLHQFYFSCLYHKKRYLLCRTKERGICMKKRYFFAALLLVLTFLACCSIALADDGIEVPPAELISDNPNFSIVDWHLNVMPLDEALKLTRTTAAISKVDSTHVGVRGVTQTNKTCVYVKGFMTIQQWKNNQWNNYTTASYSSTNTNETSGDTSIAVASGYYYRLIIDHMATDYDGNSVDGSTTTKSVLIN